MISLKLTPHKIRTVLENKYGRTSFDEIYDRSIVETQWSTHWIEEFLNGPRTPLTAGGLDMPRNIPSYFTTELDSFGSFGSVIESEPTSNTTHTSFRIRGSNE